MKTTSLILFLLLFMTSKNVVSQTIKDENILDKKYYFELNEEEIDNFNNKAKNAYNEAQFELAGDFYIKAFQYSSGTKKSILHNALISFISAKSYTKAHVCYSKLLKLGVDFLEKEAKYKDHKNMAIMYDAQGESELFFNSIQLAQNIKPDNIEVILLKATYYYKVGDINNFIVLLKKANDIDAKNFAVNYNLGVVYYENKDLKKAKFHYKKALKIDKNNESANLNFAVLLLSTENDVVNEMNSLGYSKTDRKKYKLLKRKRKKIHKSVIPYLKKVIKINSNNKEAIRTLTDIYKNLGYTNRLKKL